jgi:ubiquinol-cytochrome c reductase cytochrome b subunit
MASNSSFEKYKSDGSLQGNLLEWFDARFPATSMWRGHLSEYYAPKNFNFWYFFGSLAMLVLVIQIVTGIFLVMHYKPDASINANGIPVAFASVEYIMRDVPWGWLIRYMHSTGASAFFVVVYLHMFRGMLYGSYRQPRELIWVFGTLIFLCLMAEAFMGYLLPWGQMSFWGAQVIVNLFSAIPLIGEPLSIWIRGDFVVGDATLNRFFSFHVIAVPLVLLGLVAAHILALHEVGSNNPDGVEIKKRKDVHGIPLDGIPFHPYYSVKDIVGVVVFLMVFSIIVFFAPEGGGYFLEYNNFLPADPLKTPPHIAPVWYFTPYYSLLRAMVWPLFGYRRQVLGRRGDGCRGRDSGLSCPGWTVARSNRSVIAGRSSRPADPVRDLVLPPWLPWHTTAVLRLLRRHPERPVAQVLSAYYFLYFLTMPWWSRIDKYKPEPDRVTM